MKHITATSTSAAETKIFFIYICSIADIAETNFFYLHIQHRRHKSAHEPYQISLYMTPYCSKTKHYS